MKNKIEGVYKITCKANNRIYIGKSIDVNTRLKQHKYTLKNNKHINKKLQTDFNKYGEDVFLFEIIKKTETPIQSYYYESYYVEKYNTFNKGYNIGKLRKAKSIKTVIKNLDTYINKVNELIEKVPITDCYRILKINEKTEKIFKLSKYDIVTLFSLIRSFINIREGLSIDINIENTEIHFIQTNMDRLENLMDSFII